MLSNFCYFYWYAWLKTFYEKKVGKLSTAANLAIGALAGAINMSMTLPWEVISTYIQTSGNPNQSQWDVLQALYKQDGVFRDHVLVDGEYKNWVELSLLDHEYHTICRPKLVRFIKLYSVLRFKTPPAWQSA